MPQIQDRRYQRREVLKLATSTAVMAAIGATVASSYGHAASPSGKDYPEIASGDPPAPEFHGPRVVGTTPGRDFIFRVPHTGQGAVAVSARGLPDGLRMDNAGIITGKVKRAGEYKVRLTARNNLGSAHRTLRIVAGEHKLALTPLMGWEAWNVFGTTNNAERTRQAAAAMVRSGLAAKGYNYIIVDEGAQLGRDADGELMVPASFGGYGAVKNLIDYVHSQGLRYGTYSSPGVKTCAGNTGSYGHVLQDAKTYARWGVDYLKYDWCSYSQKVPRHPDLEQRIKPYREMRQALDQIDRDIAYSICQYGLTHVWTWGGTPPVWGNTYRISTDITDSWGSIYNNGFKCDGNLFPFAGPGHWNDPDMLVVGYGWFEAGPTGSMHWTNLTPHEQLTHITLWCMLAAPLLLGCDLEKLDKFTTDLITNTEVLAVDQDELGIQGQRVYRQGSVEVWARPLWDGTAAVAVFNCGSVPASVTIPSWDMLDPVLRRGEQRMRGKQSVRDLWKRRDLGLKATFSAKIPIHGALMLKVGTPNNTDD
ncbi:MAG: glycoside hydrolase family 27 protein [Phycisphaerae bacterium]